MRNSDTVTITKEMFGEFLEYKRRCIVFGRCIAIMYNSKGTDFNFRIVDSKLAKSLGYNSRKDMIIDLKHKGYMKEDEETHTQKKFIFSINYNPLRFNG